MTKLLDSSICIDLIRGRAAAANQRFLEDRRAGEVLVLSSIVLLELWYGAYNSPRPELHAQRLRDFLGHGLPVSAFDARAAEEAGRIRAGMRAQGQMIGTLDILIAAQAIVGDMILVTGNLKDFRRIPALKLESWAGPQSE